MSYIKEVVVNGVNLKSLLTVLEISKPLMGAKENHTKETSSVDGSHHSGSKMKSYSITIKFALTGSDSVTTAKKRSLIALLLEKEIMKIELSDEPDVYYEGYLDGEIQEEEYYRDQHRIGSFTIVLPRPYAFSKLEYAATIVDGQAEIYLDGNVPTEPIIELVANSNTSALSIVSSDEIFTLGTPADVETETETNATPYVLNDNMSNTSLWSTYHNTTDFKVQGTPISNGWSFMQNFSTDPEKPGERDYGTGTQWHGFAVMRSLTESLNDFEAIARVEMWNHQNAKHIGLVDMLGLDEQGNEVFRLSLSDPSTASISPRFGCRVGNSAGVSDSMVYTEAQGGGKAWSHFVGTLKLKREGLKYTAEIENQKDKTAYAKKSFTKTYYNASAYGRRLAQIVIRTAAHSTYQVTPTLAFHDVWVKKLGKPAQNQVDQVIKAGDTITIDSETGQVLKNGNLWMTDIYELSKFIKLHPGANVIQVYPDTATGSITFRKRYNT